MKTLKPLKRHPALIPLSHDHHRALMAAQRLKRGESAVPSEESLPVSILDLWEGELEEHFRQEEEYLFPEAASVELAAMVARARNDHDMMRRLIDRCRSGGLEGEDGIEFGRILERHIRFEERELFERFQAELGPERFAVVAERVTGAGGSCSTS